MESQRFSIGEVKELGTMVADRLAEMILSGDLKPSQRLVQNCLAEQFGVSRAAIRDGLHQLIQRGLAEKIPRKGIIVRPIEGSTLRDIIQVRRVLEIMAAKEACAKMTAEDLQHLENIVQAQEVLTQKALLAQQIKKDWEFHMSLYSHCDNETLKKIIADLWSRMRQAQGLAQVNVEWTEKWLEKSATFHRRLLNALRQRDADSVEQLLTGAFDFVEAELVRALQDMREVNNPSPAYRDEDAGELSKT